MMLVTPHVSDETNISVIEDSKQWSLLQQKGQRLKTLAQRLRLWKSLLMKLVFLVKQSKKHYPYSFLCEQLHIFLVNLRFFALIVWKKLPLL